MDSMKNSLAKRYICTHYSIQMRSSVSIYMLCDIGSEKNVDFKQNAKFCQSLNSYHTNSDVIGLYTNHDWG